jgi:C_GCAxxG_C_C family probable redox protein
MSARADASIRRARRRSVANLLCMGHCAPAVMQTLLEASHLDAPALVRAAGGLPGGIGNSGEECGGVTAPLMLLGVRHARDPLDRGVPVVVYKGQDLLRRFAGRHKSVRCREIRGSDRLPWRCIGVVRQAPEGYDQTADGDTRAAIPDNARHAFARLHAHQAEQQFHCAHAVLTALQPTLPVDAALQGAVSGFAGGTAFSGRTCGALTTGIIALSAALGGVERSRLRVLRMIGLMAVGGNAFADDRNAFNTSMNRGHRLAQWFAGEFGSTQCRALTGCDFSTAAGVQAYIDHGEVARCARIARRVAARVDEIVTRRAARLPVQSTTGPEPESDRE